MDVESQETLKATIDAAHAAIVDVVERASIKFEQLIRDAIAEGVSAADGWQLSISPITIELRRKLK